MQSYRRRIQRTLNEDQVKDLKNARGCGVPWPTLAKHYGLPVAELQRLSGQPQWKDLEQPTTQGTLFDCEVSE
jgi:hypothetical protein